MTMPKVSICIPAYKNTGSLRRALDSIYLQNYQDYEIIITDDTPDDSVRELINGSNFRGALKYFKNEQTLGSPENWNEAIRHASGNYIKILHHDDWFYDENSLLRFVEMLDINQNADFGFCPSLHYGPNNNYISTHTPSEKKLKTLSSSPEILFFGNFVGAPSATIFRNKYGMKFDRRLKWVVDIDFYIRLLKQNRHFVYKNEKLICINLDDDGRVTGECQNNKCVELFEYTYLYNKLDLSRFSYKARKHFVKLLRKYNVASVKEIVECGYDGDMPKTVLRAMIYINFMNSFNLFKKN